MNDQKWVSMDKRRRKRTHKSQSRKRYTQRKKKKTDNTMDGSGDIEEKSDGTQWLYSIYSRRKFIDRKPTTPIIFVFEIWMGFVWTKQKKKEEKNEKQNKTTETIWPSISARKKMLKINCARTLCVWRSVSVWCVSIEVQAAAAAVANK